MKDDDEVKQKAELCKKLSLKVVDVFMEDDVEFDIALSVLCQLYVKIGLDFDVNPFGLLGAVSKTLEVHLEAKSIEDEANGEPKVHWQGNGTQFH
jgi:hypothetical protein